MPLTNEEGDPLSDEEKIEKLVGELKKAYKKNQSLAKANKSLRLQLHQATKKTLSQKTKHEIVREIMSVSSQYLIRFFKKIRFHSVKSNLNSPLLFAVSVLLQPFFTPTQIDCFCRPSWLRSRNWSDQDFELALILRKLMSKKAFGYLRKKRVVPMPSLTSLRKYQREHGIVIQHNLNKTGVNLKGSGKKKQTAKKVVPMSSASIRTIGNNSKMMQAINVPVSTIIQPTNYEGQQIQIVNASGATIGTVQGVLAANNPASSQVQTIQLQVVDEHPQPQMKRIKTDEENWKFIQVTPDGQTTTYIQQK